MAQAMATQGSPGMARLIRLDTGTETSLAGDLSSVGRHSGNQIIVPDKQASRRHALIVREDNAYWIADLGSPNGTLVNGQPLKGRHALRNGDEITIGATHYRFVAPDGTPFPVSKERTAPRMADPTSAFPNWKPAESVFGMVASFHPPTPLPAAAGGSPPPTTGPAISVSQVTIAPPKRVPQRLLLRAIAGPDSGKTYELRGTSGALGRASNNPVAIADAGLSRRHARISYRKGAYWLTDLESTNGTYVNGERLTSPRLLFSGDEIEFGKTRLVVAVEDV
jgi:pSer/pThr/pTyr-binding forkhead associated (FHA) protein